MAQFDLSGPALTGFRSSSPEPARFDEFWARTLQLTRAHALGATFEPVETGWSLVDVFDVTYAGWNGEPIRGWLTLPRDAGDGARLPAVVEYIGYGGGRGLATEPSLYALAGWAHFRMDTRGQGSSHSPGVTNDPDPSGDPQVPGFMTRGILDPERYYFRRVYADAVRAVDAVRAHPRVDTARVAVVGGSQGGGITIAAAGLVDDLVAVVPDVPFLCDFRRATTMVDTAPYAEIRRYCATHRDKVDQVFATLDHMDGVHHAARGRAPSLWSVALMDDVCPPSTVYAAYNAYQGSKRIVEYAFNGHEGGAQFHNAPKLNFLHEAFAAVPAAVSVSQPA